jgi:hypothetical protein
MTETNLLGVLQLGLTASGLLGAGIGWVKSVKARGAYEERVEQGIKSLNTRMEAVERTIGNGGIRGLKADMNDMKVSCAARMAKIETIVGRDRGRE